ncbi:MAG: 50S ribosomal protein L9 [Flavobacteriaceae bacterium]|nr:50S ribosomal protein L9 [Flavobacteriaceae bacterium]
MEIILRHDVKSLGYKDDVVKVKNGYANNYLIPRGMAVLATATRMKDLKEDLKQAQFKQEKIKANAAQVAETMTDLSLTIGAKAGANGKIFGSVTSLQISQALKLKGYEIDRRKIVLDGDVKSLGSHTVTINLTKEVHVVINVEVVAE